MGVCLNMRALCVSAKTGAMRLSVYLTVSDLSEVEVIIRSANSTGVPFPINADTSDVPPASRPRIESAV